MTGTTQQRDDLAAALEGFWLTIAGEGRRMHGQIADPGEVADVLHATLSRIAAERHPDEPAEAAQEKSPGRAACEAFWEYMGTGPDGQPPAAAWDWAGTQGARGAWMAASQTAAEATERIRRSQPPGEADRWNRLRAEIAAERATQDQAAAEHAEYGRDHQSEEAYRVVRILDRLLVTMDRMAAPDTTPSETGTETPDA